MTAFLWVMVALFVSNMISEVPDLSAKCSRSESFLASLCNVVLNVVLLVWAAYLISQ